MTSRLIFIIVSSLTLGHLVGQPVPTAAEILKKVADNYSKAKRLLVRGSATFEGPGDGVKSSPFLLALEWPDKFRLEGVSAVFGVGRGLLDPIEWIADGETMWIFDRPSSKYNKIRRSSPVARAGTAETGYPALDRPELTMEYLKTNVPGWSPGVPDQHRLAKITGAEVLSVDGHQIDCYIVQSDDEQFSKNMNGTTRETLWIDKRRSVVWRRDELTWVNSGRQYHVRIDLTNVKLDGSLPKGMFTFSPPKDSRLVPIPQ